MPTHPRPARANPDTWWRDGDAHAYATARALHANFACWWVLYSPSERAYHSYWLGPHYIELVREANPERLRQAMENIQRGLQAPPAARLRSHPTPP